MVTPQSWFGPHAAVLTRIFPLSQEDVPQHGLAVHIAKRGTLKAKRASSQSLRISFPHLLHLFRRCALLRHDIEFNRYRGVASLWERRG